MNKSEVIASLIYHHAAIRQALVHMRNSQTCHADVDAWNRRIEALDEMKSSVLKIKAKEELNFWHLLTAISFVSFIVSLGFSNYIPSVILFGISFWFAHLADRHNQSS